MFKGIRTSLARMKPVSDIQAEMQRYDRIPYEEFLKKELKGTKGWKDHIMLEIAFGLISVPFI